MKEIVCSFHGPDRKYENLYYRFIDTDLIGPICNINKMDLKWHKQNGITGVVGTPCCCMTLNKILNTDQRPCDHTHSHAESQKISTSMSTRRSTQTNTNTNSNNGK